MGRSAQEPLGELLHPLVAGRAGPIEKAADMLAQPGLAPIVSGGLLGAGRLAGAGGLEQRVGGGPVEVRMALRWQPVVTPGRLVACILFSERARHGAPPLLTPGDDTADARCAGSPGPRGCRAASLRGRRAPASPGPPAGPRRPPADGWRSCGAACGGRPASCAPPLSRRA